MNQHYCDIRVAGVSYEGRQEYVKKLRGEERLLARREPENEFDENAIAIFTMRDEKIGYVPKEIAAELASLMDLGRDVHIVVLSIEEEQYGYYDDDCDWISWSFLGVNIRIYTT